MTVLLSQPTGRLEAAALITGMDPSIVREGGAPLLRFEPDGYQGRDQPSFWGWNGREFTVMDARQRQAIAGLREVHSPRWTHDPASGRATLVLRSRTEPLEQASVACESGQPVLSLRYQSGQEPPTRQVDADLGAHGDAELRLRLVRDGNSAIWSARPVAGDVLAMLAGRLDEVIIFDRTDAEGNSNGWGLSLAGSTNAIGAALRGCGAGGVAAPAVLPRADWVLERSPRGVPYAYSMPPAGPISRITILCGGDNILLYVAMPAGRPGSSAELTLAGASSSARISLRRTANDGEWRSAVNDTGAADLLMSGAASLRVQVDQGSVGTLSLAGASGPIGEAWASCWQPASNAARQPMTAPDQASDEAQIRALVAGIYDRYAREPGEGGEPQADVSPGLDALIARAVAASGAEGLEFDIFCECQDWADASYVIQAVSARGDAGEARIAFTNFGETHLMILRLVKTPSGWRVDDIIGRNGRTLRAGLRR